jgi:Fe-S-cluster containining protein
MDFPSFVSSEECLSCRGCCRFSEVKSPWRPRVSAQEIKAMHARGGTETQNPVFFADFDEGYVRAKEHNGHAQCVFLMPFRGLTPPLCSGDPVEERQTELIPSDHRCRIYENRPLECRFYPFLFLKKEDRFWVGVHLSCSAVWERRHGHLFTNYLLGLKVYFQSPEVIDLLKARLAWEGDDAAHADEIEELFPLDFKL